MNTTATMTKSHAIAVFPILLALKELIEINKVPFLPINDDQKYVVDLLSEIELVAYPKDQIKSFVSNDIKKLNEILKEHNFDIRLIDDHNPDDDYAVVTIADLIGNWCKPGVTSEVAFEGQKYPAIRLEEGTSIVKAGNTEILIIDTIEVIEIGKRKFKTLHVCIEKTDQERSGVELFRHIEQLSKHISKKEKYSCNATVPFVMMDNQPDLNWLLGLPTSLKTRFITQALQQNRLKLDLHGIHAESATAVVSSFGGTDKECIVDQPFNIWLSYMELTGVEVAFPLFAAYVAPDCWKKPK